MWNVILRVALAASQRPEVRAWAKRKAGELAARLVRKAEGLRLIADLGGAVAALPAPGTLTRIATDRDCLRPGQLFTVDERPYRITRVVSSNARGETVYEAIGG